jgi:hypothetical protein
LSNTQLQALLNPVFSDIAQDINTHPLVWTNSVQYDYSTDSFTGSLDALVDSLAAQAPSAAAAKQDFWFDNVPLLRSVMPQHEYHC